MTVLVTGSRQWRDRARIRAALLAAGATLVVHGGQRTLDPVTRQPVAGADWHADEAARELGIPTRTYPADWNRHGKAAGPLRNQQMIDANPDIGLCLAFPLPDSLSRGTFDCVRRAVKAGIPIRTP